MDQWHPTAGSELFYIDSLVEPCFDWKQMGFIACNVLKLFNLLIFRKKAFAYIHCLLYFSLGSFRINSLKFFLLLGADGFHRLKGWRVLTYTQWNQTQTGRLYKQLYVKVNSPSEFYFTEKNDTFAFQFEFFLKLLLYLLRKTPLWCSLFSCFSKKSKKTNK